MRTIIAGSRTITNTNRVFEILDKYKNQYPITEIVCGMARGVDLIGRDWGIQNSLPIKEFAADWNGLGKKAGYLRNVEMAKNADALVAFLPINTISKGTQHMIQIARDRGLYVTVYEI